MNQKIKYQMKDKKEYFRDYNKEYYAKNKSYYKEYFQKYYLNNQDKMKNTTKNWNKLNKKQDATVLVSIEKGVKTILFE